MAATLTWLMQAEGAGAGESIFRSFKDGKVNYGRCQPIPN
jgi:hypothetical protein